MKYLNSFQSFDKIMEKAEVKYSQTALNQIMDLIKKYDEKSSIFKNRKSLLQELGFVFDEKGNPKIKIQVPLKEIVYSESPKIQLGLVIFGILSSFQNELIEIEKNHIDKKKWEGLDRDTYRICKTIFKHWIETKKIHPLGRQIITKILHEGEIEHNFILKFHDEDGHYNYHRSEIAIGKAERNTDEKKWLDMNYNI
jgi:hypothetical protein